MTNKIHALQQHNIFANPKALQDSLITQMLRAMSMPNSYEALSSPNGLIIAQREEAERLRRLHAMQADHSGNIKLLTRLIRLLMNTANTAGTEVYNSLCSLIKQLFKQHGGNINTVLADQNLIDFTMQHHVPMPSPSAPALDEKEWNQFDTMVEQLQGSSAAPSAPAA